MSSNLEDFDGQACLSPSSISETGGAGVSENDGAVDAS